MQSLLLGMIYTMLLIIAVQACEIERDLNGVAHELHVYNAWHQ